MFGRYKVSDITPKPPKNKKPFSMLVLALICVVPALALLRSTVFSNNKNFLASENSTKYDIVVDLGEGGRFEPGSKPEFTKMDNGKWIHKYTPGKDPVKLPTPVKDGYIFEGWLVGNDQTPKPEYSIPTWNKENINLSVKWKAAESILLPGFRFEQKIKSMPNFANVTEIKFVKATPNPNGIDLSKAQDGSIKGNILGNVLTVACERPIYANPDCSVMFRNMGNLTTINFNNFDTSKVTDMSNMFRDCSSLTTLDVSKFDTSKVTDMRCMFLRCSSLTTLDVSNWNISKVTDMNIMFDGCSSLTTLDVSKWDTSQVTDMSSMFSSCSKLTTLDVSKWDTSQITNMWNTFDGCSSLTTLDVSNWNISKVTDMRYMFSGCSKLTTLDVSKWDTSQVTDMSSMFDGCSSLTTLDVSKWNTSQVTVMWHMFSSCSKLTTLDVSKWDTSQITNMWNTFDGCSSLTTLDVSKWDTSQVTDMRYMFSGCSKLTTLDVSKWDTSQVTVMWSMFEGCSKLSGEITISNPNIDAYSSMFKGCSSDPNAKFIVKYTSPETKALAKNMVNTKNPGDHVYLWESEAILLPGSEFNSKIKAMPNFANVTEIKFVKAAPNTAGTDLSESQDGSIRGHISGNVLTVACDSQMYANPDSSKMFKDMENLVTINLAVLNTSKVTDMSHMFNVQTLASNWDPYTAKITNIYGLNTMDTSKVTNMAHMFHGCSSISSIDVSGFNTSKVTDMSSMFEGCESITRLDITNFNTNSLTKMDCIFKKCKKVVNIVGHENINTSKVTSLEDVFYYCRELKNINVARWNVDNVTCGYRTFCVIDEPGTTIQGLENWNVSKLTDMGSMFSSLGVSNLNGIRNWDTSNVTNMRWTFNAIGSKTRHDFDTSVFSYLKYGKVENGVGMFRGIKTNNYVIENIDFPSAVDFSDLFNNSQDAVRITFRNITFKQGRDISSMFSASQHLEYLDMSNVDIAYTEATNLFGMCNELRTIKGLESFDFTGVIDTINMFSDCYNLTGRVTINNPNLIYMNMNISNPRTSHMFWETGERSSGVYLDYTNSSCRAMAQKIINDKSYYSKLYLGNQVYRNAAYKSNKQNLPELREVGCCRGKIVDEMGTREKYIHYAGATCPNCGFGKDDVSIPKYAAAYAHTSTPHQLTLINGTSAQYPKQVITVTSGKIPSLATPELNPQYAGQFGGYYYDEQFTKPVKAGDVITQDITIYARW